MNPPSKHETWTALTIHFFFLESMELDSQLTEHRSPRFAGKSLGKRFKEIEVCKTKCSEFPEIPMGLRTSCSTQKLWTQKICWRNVKNGHQLAELSGTRPETTFERASEHSRSEAETELLGAEIQRTYPRSRGVENIHIMVYSNGFPLARLHILLSFPAPQARAWCQRRWGPAPGLWWLPVPSVRLCWTHCNQPDWWRIPSF